MSFIIGTLITVIASTTTLFRQPVVIPDSLAKQAQVIEQNQLHEEYQNER